MILKHCKVMNISCRIISHDDIVNSGCFNMPNAIEIVEKTLVDYSKGLILYPDKVSQIFDEESQSRINCLPATLLKDKVSGMKWVSVFPDNPKLRNLENLTAMILLSDITTGYPMTLMEGTLCSALRTAAVSATAAKYLAKKTTESIGIVGAGEQAKMHFVGMKTVYPQIKYCKVASRSPNSEMKFIQTLERKYPEVIFEQCFSDYEKACTNSDIIVSAISGQEPIIKMKWLDEGVFYCHVGGWEDEYDVALGMDKIVTDDWESVKHRTQTISRLYKLGLLKDSDIYADLYEIVINKKDGRINDREKVYFNSVGLSYIDVALALDFYNRVKNNSLGIQTDLRNCNIFDSL